MSVDTYDLADTVRYICYAAEQMDHTLNGVICQEEGANKCSRSIEQLTENKAGLKETLQKILERL